MIEIIKPGTKNIIDCDYCGAKLRYALDDIQHRETYTSQIESYTESYIVCPQCHRKIKI